MTKRQAQPENKELSEYKQKLFGEAEKIVKEVYPKKVLEFDALLKSPELSYSRLDEIVSEKNLNIPVPDVENGASHDEPSAKRKRVDLATGPPVLAFSCGTVPCNQQLIKLMDKVRPMLRDSVEQTNTVKMWITLLIPRIEDGNNFGVGIQEETLGEVRNVESEAASFLDQMSRYFTTRGKLITKIAKYPHVADYRRAILDMDEKQFINIRLVVLEMRNHFSTLHDMIMKNYEKIKVPRNSNTEHLY